MPIRLRDFPPATADYVAKYQNEVMYRPAKTQTTPGYVSLTFANTKAGNLPIELWVVDGANVKDREKPIAPGVYQVVRGVATPIGAARLVALSETFDRLAKVGRDTGQSWFDRSRTLLGAMLTEFDAIGHALDAARSLSTDHRGLVSDLEYEAIRAEVTKSTLPSKTLLNFLDEFASKNLTTAGRVRQAELNGNTLGDPGHVPGLRTLTSAQRRAIPDHLEQPMAILSRDVGLGPGLVTRDELFQQLTRVLELAASKPTEASAKTALAAVRLAGPLLSEYQWGDLNPSAWVRQAVDTLAANTSTVRSVKAKAFFEEAIRFGTELGGASLSQSTVTRWDVYQRSLQRVPPSAAHLEPTKNPLARPANTVEPATAEEARKKLLAMDKNVKDEIVKNPVGVLASVVEGLEKNAIPPEAGCALFLDYLNLVHTRLSAIDLEQLATVIQRLRVKTSGPESATSLAQIGRIVPLDPPLERQPIPAALKQAVASEPQLLALRESDDSMNTYEFASRVTALAERRGAVGLPEVQVVVDALREIDLNPHTISWRARQAGLKSAQVALIPKLLGEVTEPSARRLLETTKAWLDATLETTGTLDERNKARRALDLTLPLAPPTLDDRSFIAPHSQAFLDEYEAVFFQVDPLSLNPLVPVRSLIDASWWDDARRWGQMNGMTAQEIYDKTADGWPAPPMPGMGGGGSSSGPVETGGTGAPGGTGGPAPTMPWIDPWPFAISRAPVWMAYLDAKRGGYTPGFSNFYAGWNR